MKILFWNTDTQKDFVNKDGALYVEGAESIKPNLKKLTDIANSRKIKVVNTCDRHVASDEEISDKPDFINTFPKHCMAGTEGVRFIEETNPYGTTSVNFYTRMTSFALAKTLHWVSIQQNIIIIKDKFDVFRGNQYTEKILKALNPNLVFVYGVAGDYCVSYAVKGLVERGYTVTVVIDAVQSLKETPIKEWYKLGVTTIFTRDLINLLSLK